jgi:hypothetical protein
MSKRTISTALTVMAAVAGATLALAPACASAATPATPTIRAVHFSYLGPNMRIEVDGTGFGTPAIGLPYNGTVPNFQFSDTSRGESWGENGNWPLEYTSWTNNRVAVNGLASNGSVQAGDQVAVSVSNRDGSQAANWSGTLGSSPSPALVAGQPNPVITGVGFAGIGANIKIVVSGAGFGGPTIGMPYPNGNVSNFNFSDTSRGETWGGSGNWPTNFASWSETKVAVYGLDGNGMVQQGDQFDVTVQNAKSGEYFTWSGTLAPSTAAAPPSAPSPTPAPKNALKLSSAVAAAGGHEMVTAAVKAGESTVLVVEYPSGSQKVLGPTMAGAGGQVSFTWAIPSSVRGLVHVTLEAGGVLTEGSFKVS